MKLELKSFAIGVLLTVNVLMLLGLNSNDEESQIGRYQSIVVADGWIFVYDTTNGKFVKNSRNKLAKKEIENNPNRLDD